MMGLLIYILIGVIVVEIKLRFMDLLSNEPLGWKIFYYAVSVISWPMVIAMALAWGLFALGARIMDFIDDMRRK